jgi:hypothetical protein
MQNRRHFRPQAPPIDRLWKKPAPSPRPSDKRRRLRPNVRLDQQADGAPRSAAQAAAASAMKTGGAASIEITKPVETPTPPPTAVSSREIPPAPPSARTRRRRKRRLQWAAFVASAVIAFVVCSFSDSTTLRETPARAASAVGDFFHHATVRVSSSLSEARAAAAEARVEESPAAPPPEYLKINRYGHVSVPGGILVFPDSFETTDGAYDLWIHFHGNTAVVKESAEVAHVNAAVAIINVGVGSGPYEEYYAQPGTYEDLLAAIDHGLKERGVANPHVRRIAISGWSAGYGAVSTILRVRKKTDPLDAIMLFDGIHCSFEGASSAAYANEHDVDNLSPELAAARANNALNVRQLSSFLDAAKDAADGRIYFGITHSDIDPITYASTARASGYLIEQLGLTKIPLDPVKDAPPYVELESMANAVDHSKEKHMEPYYEVRKGGFHVIGYKGVTQEHHMAHLFEMSQTLLPELVKRWAN